MLTSLDRRLIYCVSAGIRLLRYHCWRLSSLTWSINHPGMINRSTFSTQPMEMTNMMTCRRHAPENFLPISSGKIKLGHVSYS